MAIAINEGMKWPPNDNVLGYKMAEHAAWYSGEAEVLANFYNEVIATNFLNLPYSLKKADQTFWGRQIRNQGEVFVHVPIAGDIAETSANLLFGESPMINIVQAHEEKASILYKESQTQMDKVLLESGLFRKILEGAETAAALGGVYIKLAWDASLSKYPIPVIVQSDKAIPEFRFGILRSVIFWKVVHESDDSSKVYRLLERYEVGSISYKLYQGTHDKLGREVPLTTFDDTKDLEDVDTGVDMLLAAYVPNMLPNRIDRNSYLGKSDYQGVEGLMDSLDEIYSSWVRDILISGGTIHVPESFLRSDGRGGRHFNTDQMVYVKLDMDPLAMSSKEVITATQFDIRADKFEKTALNFLERIIVAAGYSPQSFGLNIQGRAESGTALNIRERKSLATKNKKEQYWQPALKHLVKAMALLYNAQLGGNIAPDSEYNVSFTDSLSNSFAEIAGSVKMVADAIAASTETKVRLLHPEWDEDQIKQEVEAIKAENHIGESFENPDMFEMGGGNEDE